MNQQGQQPVKQPNQENAQQGTNLLSQSLGPGKMDFATMLTPEDSDNSLEQNPSPVIAREHNTRKGLSTPTGRGSDPEKPSCTRDVPDLLLEMLFGERSQTATNLPDAQVAVEDNASPQLNCGRIDLNDTLEYFAEELAETWTEQKAHDAIFQEVIKERKDEPFCRSEKTQDEVLDSLIDLELELNKKASLSPRELEEIKIVEEWMERRTPTPYPFDCRSRGYCSTCGSGNTPESLTDHEGATPKKKKQLLYEPEMLLRSMSNPNIDPIPERSLSKLSNKDELVLVVPAGTTIF